MPEIQLGAHTVRSHGIKVARTHMHDWLILLLLIVIEVILNVIEPFHRFVGEDMMTDLKYPLKDNTVPFWAVPMIAIVLPFFVILVYYFIRRDVYDLHHAILGLLFSVLITGVITDAIKDAVGRPRPDFFWRCFPDGKGVFDSVTKDVMCTGLKSVIKEGHKSFPSGHTSWSFAGLGFLALYLSGKIRVFDRRGHVAKLCIVFLPLLIAALVGVSRVDDYWHHWQDVFAGGLLGLTVSSFCYLQFFPAPYDADGIFLRALFSTFVTLWPFSPFYMTFWVSGVFDTIIHKMTLKHVVNRESNEHKGWGPHAYFQMLAESQNGNPSNTINGPNAQQSELQSVYVESQHGRELSGDVGNNTYDSSSPILDITSGLRRY